MSHGMEYLQSATKRNLDIVGSIAVAAAILPPFAVAATITTIDNHIRDPFFRQTRLGRQNALFDIIKLRTMPPVSQEKTRQRFGTVDPRASRVGNLIRKVGVDEAPQLMNVIKGEMSLVGIRPFMPEDIDRFAVAAPKLFEDWHTLYTETKPGLTGESQIFRHHCSTTSSEMLRKTMEMDLRYAESASYRTDLRLLATTPAQLLHAVMRPLELPATEQLAS